MFTVEIDVELVLGKLSRVQISKLESALPAGYVLEDQTSRGWGIVLRTESTAGSDVSEAVLQVLNDLEPHEQSIVKMEGGLHIGLFYDTATCTAVLSKQCIEVI